MKRLMPIIMLLIGAMAFGCAKKKSEQELLNEIQQLEAKEDFSGALKLLQEYVDRFSNSEKTPVMMNKLAMLYGSTEKNFLKAVEIYRQLIKNFPDSPEAIKAQFMIGYLYANEIKDLDQAKVEYETFLQKYPDHELASSVKWELEHLGKDISEIDIFAKSDGETDGNARGSAKK